MILWIVNPTDSTRTRVRLLLDTGSNATFMVNKKSLKKITRILGQQRVVLQAFGEPPDCRERDIGYLSLTTSPHSLACEKFHYLQVILVDTITNPILSHQLSDYESDYITSNHVILADPEAARSNLLDIHILVGQDHYHDLVRGPGEKHCLSSGLALTPTVNGYTLGGRLDSSTSPHHPISIHAANYVSSFRSIPRDQEVIDMKQFTSLENLGVAPKEEISPVLDRFNHTTTHNGLHYCSYLPKRAKRLKKLKTQFGSTFQRFRSTYENLSKPGKEDQFKAYDDIIKEQLETGVLEKVGCIGTIEEVQRCLQENPGYFDNFKPVSHDSIIHYLKHFSVRKKSSGKLRLVYDASYKSKHSNEYSLNDCLETGPDLINSLLALLIKFRLHKYVLKSDIRKAFLQIEIYLADRDLLRSLWIEGDQVCIYRFARLPFGLTCAPFILAATLKKHLFDSGLSLKEQHHILDSFYVDDNLTGAEALEGLVDLKFNMEELFSKAGMTLTQFNSNHPDMRKLLDATEESVPEVETVLGVLWYILDDDIGINAEHTAEPDKPIKHKRSRANNTKRSVYSKLGKTFDPLGLISPFTFSGKLILRDICNTIKAWDTKLPEKYLDAWRAWSSQLCYLSSFRVPRYVGLQGASSTTIAGFCDASKLGFAACIYLIAKDEDGNTVSNLLVAKTRVAPKEVLGIPRLELCGALLLTNLMSHVKRAVPPEVSKNLYYFTDSADVLFWIRSDSYDWPVWVSNRLKQIRDGSDVESWRHVPTKENPADIPSRGCRLSEICEDSDRKTLWLKGPNFIKGNLSSYRSKVDVRIMPAGCQQELGKVSLCTRSLPPSPDISSLIDISDFSSYRRLIRTTNVILKGVDRLCLRLFGVQRNVEQSKTLDNPYSHAGKAELLWIKSIQHTYFNDLFILAKKSFSRKNRSSFNNIPAESKNMFFKMDIFLDKDMGLLRCKTRTQNSLLDFATTNPILLPTESSFTALLIKDTHERLLHAGKSQTVAAIRAEFWVPRLTKLTSRLLGKCIACRRAYGTAYPLPPYPALPDFRVCRSKPFANIGLDFAGPFYTRERFVDKTFFDYKSYIILFTCASSRAVHIEATNSLNAFDFQLAFERFISDCGVPEAVVSDNAKTFEYANRHLKAIYKNRAVQQFLSGHRIQWNFYTDKAPWMGGFIERAVGLFKKISNKIIGAHHISFEEFRTVIKSAQATINSRPLTYLCEGKDEGVPLTPSMLICGRNLTDLPPHGASHREKSEERKKEQKDNLKLAERYHMLETIKDSFWSSWSTQYLTELHERHMRQRKLSASDRVPKVGDICLLRKEKTPRRHWPLAIIEKVHICERDGKVRTVSLKTHNENGKISIIQRSPSFLVPLEEDCGDS